MKLVDMTVKNYLDVLGSDAPAPGGGSVSALSAAQGAALVAMVCELTLGKEKYQENHKLCQEVKEEIQKIQKSLTEGIDRDTEAFNVVSAAYKMPKDTEEQKAARSKAIAEATYGATVVPYETMELCLAGLKTTAKIVGKSNPNAASDLGVAALNLLAGLKGAWLNVKINLPGVKDGTAKVKFAGGAAFVMEAEEIAAKIFEDVLESL